MVEAQDLIFRYPTSKEFRYPNLHCANGETKLIIGQSGCGKTTLLQILGGLRRPKSGTVLIDKTNLRNLTGSALDKFRGLHIGFIFQQSHFVDSLSAIENLKIASMMSGTSFDAGRTAQLLDRLAIADKQFKKPSRLSQGEQQRLAIARALVNKPGLILADEPTSALDDKNTHEVVSLLEEEAKLANAALLIVTHDTRLKHHFKDSIEL
jgi:putative ABC transport system ATP-binding protein